MKFSQRMRRFLVLAAFAAVLTFGVSLPAQALDTTDGNQAAQDAETIASDSDVNARSAEQGSASEGTSEKKADNTSNQTTDDTKPTNSNETKSETEHPATIQVWRLYNPYSGEHLFTTKESEYSALQPLGWRGEGLAWTSPGWDNDGKNAPVFRLYNPYSGEHFYTTKKDEYDSLQKIGWRGEDVAFYDAGDKGVAIWRFFNPYVKIGTHHYSANADERLTLVANGWNYEGVAWHALEVPAQTSVVEWRGNDAYSSSTGWQKIGSTWFYFDPNNGGKLLKSGWFSSKGSWYYLDPSTGAMKVGWLLSKGSWYYLDPSSGAMISGGWHLINGKWYLFQSSGATYTGWYHEPGGSLIWYYLDPDTGGTMLAGTSKVINGTSQSFRSSGIWAPSSGVKHLDDICDWVIDNVTGYSSVNNDALRKLYNWACKYPYVTENEYPGGGWRDWSIPYAQEMWDNGRGNCYRYASIVCWVARRLGYDANTVSGWVPGRNGRDAHGWCEVHIDGTTYIIDCSLGRYITSRNFFMVTYNNAPTTYHIISR